jgi:hypothetical protein
MLLKVIEKKTTLTTGRNLRQIMLLTEKNGIEEIEDVNGFFYFPMPQEEMWRTEQLMIEDKERTRV